jgi:hypothetical protein
MLAADFDGEDSAGRGFEGDIRIVGAQTRVAIERTRILGDRISGRIVNGQLRIERVLKLGRR